MFAPVVNPQAISSISKVMTGDVVQANLNALADDLDATATGHGALCLRTRTSFATPPYPNESLPSSPATATVEAAVNIREVIKKLEPNCESRP